MADYARVGVDKGLLESTLTWSYTTHGNEPPVDLLTEFLSLVESYPTPTDDEKARLEKITAIVDEIKTIREH